MSNLNLSSHEDGNLDSVLDLRKPRYDKHFANLHYQSEATNEIGCIEVRPGTTEEQIMDQYWKKFPLEAKMFMEEVRIANQELYSQNGMSEGRRMMSLGKVPEIIMCAMKFIREDYWDDKRRSINFFRKFPKFMVGNHNQKRQGNIIIR